MRQGDVVMTSERDQWGCRIWSPSKNLTVITQNSAAQTSERARLYHYGDRTTAAENLLVNDPIDSAEYWQWMAARASAHARNLYAKSRDWPLEPLLATPIPRRMNRRKL